MSMKFNEEGEKPRFIYKAHEKEPYTWVLYEFKDYKGPGWGYDPIGTYRLIDTKEKPEITEKMLKNICNAMNGKDRMESFQNLTNSKVLFHIMPKEKETDPTTIVFREHDGKGVSKENAVFTVEKGVFSDV